MAVRVDAGFSDATPQWTCRGVVPDPVRSDVAGEQSECGMRFYGDSVADAFRAWWKHQAEAHPLAHD